MKDLYEYFASSARFWWIPPLLLIITLGVSYKILQRVFKQVFKGAHKNWVRAVSMLLPGILLGFIMQGSFFYLEFATFGLIWFLAPGLIILGVAALIGWCQRRFLRVCGWLAGAGFGSGGALILSLLSGYGIYKWEVYAARNYVAQAVPVLEKIKSTTGSYPPELPIAVLGRPPALLMRGRYNSTHYGYTVFEESFHFFYVDPASMGDIAEFDSKSSTWTDPWSDEQ